MRPFHVSRPACRLLLVYVYATTVGMVLDSGDTYSNKQICGQSICPSKAREPWSITIEPAPSFSPTRLAHLSRALSKYRRWKWTGENRDRPSHLRRSCLRGRRVIQPSLLCVGGFRIVEERGCDAEGMSRGMVRGTSLGAVGGM